MSRWLAGFVLLAAIVWAVYRLVILILEVRSLRAEVKDSRERWTALERYCYEIRVNPTTIFTVYSFAEMVEGIAKQNKEA